MASAYTALLGLVLPVTGENQGTWGSLWNDSGTLLIEAAIAGTTTLSTDADVTLTTTTGSSNQAREAILLCSGARTALRTITAPAQSKIYTIINATTGGYSVKLVGAGPTTGLTIPNGASAVVAWNGSDFIEVGSGTVGNLTVNGNLSVTGNTTLGDAVGDLVTVNGTATFVNANPTLSAGTANGVLYLNGSKVATSGSALTFDGTTLTAAGLTGPHNGTVGATTPSTGAFTTLTAAALTGPLTGTVGATTPNTGAFTTLTASSTVTLNGGTANGVLYLNGSKVATSGSALTFDGTNTLQLFCVAGNSIINLEGSGTNNGIIRFKNTTTGNLSGIYGTNAKDMVFEANGAVEQMRLTSTGLGIGTSSPATKLNVESASNLVALLRGTTASGYTSMRLYNDQNSSGRALEIDYAGSTYAGNLLTNGPTGESAAISTTGAYPLVLGTNATAVMTLNSSGNVGIGTSSPTDKLHVAGNTFRHNDASGSYGYTISATSSTTTLATLFGGSSFAIQTGSSGTNQLLLDSSGNLGLGVTPSAWASAYKVAQVNNRTALVGSTSGGTYLGNNWYNDGTNKYFGSDLAALYGQVGGQHIFYTAGSGSAGATISFTQAMTLDTSGNLGIGTTSPSTFGLLAARKDATGTTTVAVVNANSAANDGARFASYFGGTLVGSFGHYWTGSEFFTNVDAYGVLRFTQQGTERARIDSSGNLLVGTTNAGAIGISISNLTNYSVSEGSNSSFVNIFRQASSGATVLANGYKWTATASGFASSYGSSWAKSAIALNSGVIQFFADTAATTAVGTDVTPTERARIISSGYSKFSNDGTYLNGSGTNHEMRQSATDVITYFTNKNGTNPYGIEIDYTALDPNGTGNSFFAAYGTTTLRAQIRSNGGLANYQANDVNLSDRREKTNFAPAKSYLDTICAIPVQTFNYVDQNLEEDPGLTLGVVAQDVQAVAPELVHESNWGTEDEPKMRLSIYQTDLQYALMKCIQEQQALITDLRARVAQLEAKG